PNWRTSSASRVRLWTRLHAQATTGFKVKKAQARFLARDEPSELESARPEDSYVFDTKGRRYIDFMMGWCVGNFGWGNAVLVKEAKTFRGPDYVYPGYSYAPWT